MTYMAGGDAPESFTEAADGFSSYPSSMRCRYFRYAASHRGMSLIEVIFAATFLCLIFMAMINILPLATFAIKRTEHRINASAIAQSVLEERRAGPFSSIDSQPATTQQIGDDKTVYTILYEAPPMDSTVDSTKLRRIVVTVTWKERGIDLSVMREMYLCNFTK
ncbi:MAG: hypothetical protein AB2L14_07335 [Candidatus Xenobiia bacterium LiM19]